MGIFNKRKKIPEPEVPGFAEIESNKIFTPTLQPAQSISKFNSDTNLDFSNAFDSKDSNEEDLKYEEEDLKYEEEDLKYEEENEDWDNIDYGNKEEEYKDIEEISNLPEIPGIEETKKEREQKERIPFIEKRNAGKVLDIKDVEKNPSQIKKTEHKIRNNKDEEEEEENEGENTKEKERKMKKNVNIDDSDKSIFVRIEDFNSVNIAINEIKNKISLIKKNMDEIGKIKEREDEEMKNWEKELILIKEKLAYVDEILKAKTEKGL